MSYIKDTIKCKKCGFETKWAWLLPDRMVDFRPAPAEFHIIKPLLEKGKYHIVMECPNCRCVLSEYYDLHGIKIGNA